MNKSEMTASVNELANLIDSVIDTPWDELFRTPIAQDEADIVWWPTYSPQ